MKIGYKILCAVLALFTLSLSACAVKLDPPQPLSPETEAKNMGFYAKDCESLVEVGEYIFLDVNIKNGYEDEIKWSSSDNSVATVDAAGRVDGIKEGKVTITATVKSCSVSYVIEVGKKSSNVKEISNAITANSSRVEQNQVFGGDVPLYGIVINKNNCCMTVFTYNDKGSYSVAVRSMVCAVGQGTLTAEVMSQLEDDRERWTDAVDGKYYQYLTRVGDYFQISSAAFNDAASASLDADSYNCIGTGNSDGNIWLSVADAKWVYENCTEGTTVRVVNSQEDAKYSPLGVPKAHNLDEESLSLNWDPTDSHKDNPYQKASVEFSGVEDTAVLLYDAVNIYEGVSVKDEMFGEDITDTVKVEGSVNINRAGEYVISYYATNRFGRTIRYDRRFYVVWSEEYVPENVKLMD